MELDVLDPERMKNEMRISMVVAGSSQRSADALERIASALERILVQGSTAQQGSVARSPDAFP